MGFRGMLTLRHVEKDALLCKRKPVKMQPVNLPCCSRRGHRHTLPWAAAGEMSSALPASILSAVSLSSYLCAGAAVHVLSPQPAEAGYWSPWSGSRRLRDVILLAQVTASKDQSRLPRCDSKPSALPTAPHQLPCAKSPPYEEDEIFLFFEVHMEQKST